MPYMQNIEYENPQYRSIVEEMRKITRQRNMYQERIDAMTRRRDELGNLHTIMEEIKEFSQTILDQHPLNKDELSSDDMSILDHIQARPTRISRSREALAVNIENDTESMDLRISSLAQQKENLENITEENKFIRLNKKELIEELSAIENIKPGSIALGENSNGKPFVRWIFTGLFMRPDEHHFNWILDEHPAVALQDCVVKISLFNNAITISPAWGEKRLCKYQYGNTTTPHPHILDNYSPCFGDFAGVIAETCSVHDWATAASVIKIFLEQAANSDSAGRNWVKGIADMDRYSYSLLSQGICRDSTLSGRPVEFTEDPDAPGHWISKAIVAGNRDTADEPAAHRRVTLHRDPEGYVQRVTRVAAERLEECQNPIDDLLNEEVEATLHSDPDGRGVVQGVTRVAAERLDQEVDQDPNF